MAARQDPPNFDPQLRLGVGARDAASAKFKSSGAGDVGDFSFKSQIAPMLMGEWLITPSRGVQVRYVHATYKIDGRHAGLGLNDHF